MKTTLISEKNPIMEFVSRDREIPPMVFCQKPFLMFTIDLKIIPIIFEFFAAG
jgi:hypothetical protein